MFTWNFLEKETTMPNPNYMAYQTEIEWSARTALIEWLLQIHMRYHMLPETLWIAINIIDRFLSNRVVSLVKLQLVGITAIFEEIMAPSVEEFVALADNCYSKDEILKGERIMLQVCFVFVFVYRLIVWNITELGIQYLALLHSLQLGEKN